MPRGVTKMSVPLDLAPVPSLDSPAGALALPTPASTTPASTTPASTTPASTTDPQPIAPRSQEFAVGSDPPSEGVSPEAFGLPTDGDPGALLEAALDKWSSELVLATSLQAEGLVMLDLLHRRTGGDLAGLRVLTLDTGRLPEETHALIDTLDARYGVKVEVHAPDPVALAGLVREFGSNGFRNSLEARRACCRVRKVEPLERALEGASAWISGLRRGQSRDRGNIATVETDPRGLVKLNPLADWTWEQVWSYVRQHSVPYHPFYDRGYTSIGCAPCTRAIRPWEDRRAGRWWWESEAQAKECGLHWARPATPGDEDEASAAAGVGRPRGVVARGATP